MERYYLREWRMLKGLTQMDLSKRSNVAQTIISSMETEPSSRRQPKTETRLATALEIFPSDLRRAPRQDEWEAADPKPTGLPKDIEEFRGRGGANVSPEEKERIMPRLAEEIARRRAERQRLERIQQLEEEERELEKLKQQLGSNGNDEAI